MLQRGFEVSIACDGKVLPEYEVQVEDEKNISCFVSSEVGKAFEIRFAEKDRAHRFSVRVDIDGHSMGGSTCQPGQAGSRWGVRTFDKCMRRPYQFARLDVTDDDMALGGAGNHEKIGTIEVSAYRIARKDKECGYTLREYQTLGPVHERAKKSGIHCVSLGEAVPCPGDRRVRCIRLHPEEGHYVKFLFRYRPLAFLQAQGIAPLPTPPQPEAVQGSSRANPSRKRKRSSHLAEGESVKTKADPDEEENLDELQAQLEKIQARIRRVKRERLSPELEGPAAKLRIIQTANKVIDLTED